MIARIRLIAKMPTIAAMAYKYSVGQPFVYPRNDLTYAENFLRMMFAVPCEDYKVNPVLAKALDRIFILHADHEQNASTSTVRLRRLVGRQPLRLHRRRHRLPVGPGARRRERGRAEHAEGDRHVDHIPEFIDRAKDKDSRFRLMGFGHRVYKNYDPRAKVHAGDLPRGAGRARPAATTRCSSSPWSSRRSRSTTSTSSSASCTPTSTSIRASCSRPWAFPTDDVHGDLRAGAHRRLDRAVERDDRGPGAEDRPAAPALHRHPKRDYVPIDKRGSAGSAGSELAGADQPGIVAEPGRDKARPEGRGQARHADRTRSR